jgi:hypothetical protein
MLGLRTKVIVGAAGLLLAALVGGRRPSVTTCEAGRPQTPQPVKSTWSATGTLLEACSCSVPCPCNFGQGPSGDSCHTVYAYRLKKAHFGDVTLDGLIFGGGEADKGVVGFLDAHATAAQRPALEKLALAVFGQGGASSGPRKFETLPITAASDGAQFRVVFGDRGGFDADVLFGRDRKRPIVVENNTTWPVERFIKGKTTRFVYQDGLGNKLQLDGVNANLGEFSLSDRKPDKSDSKRPQSTER